MACFKNVSKHSCWIAISVFLLSACGNDNGNASLPQEKSDPFLAIAALTDALKKKEPSDMEILQIPPPPAHDKPTADVVLPDGLTLMSAIIEGNGPDIEFDFPDFHVEQRGIWEKLSASAKLLNVRQHQSGQRLIVVRNENALAGYSRIVRYPCPGFIQKEFTEQRSGYICGWTLTSRRESAWLEKLQKKLGKPLLSLNQIHITMGVRDGQVIATRLRIDGELLDYRLIL